MAASGLSKFPVEVMDHEFTVAADHTNKYDAVFASVRVKAR